MRVKGWHPATGEVEMDLDERTAAMIRSGQVAGFSIATDADLQPETFRIERTHPGQRLQEAMVYMLDKPLLGAPTPDGPWTDLGHVLPDDLKLVPEDPPALDPMDVTWPDGKFKVFPDGREEYIVDVLEVAPEARSIMDRILAEVHHRQLEETILAELAAIITERGKDAPGLLIIRTPDGQWAIRESEWLAPGSAVLSTMDQPDLMAVAQGDGWLYYRQGPSRGEQMGVPPEPEEVHLDIIPELPDWVSEAFTHPAGWPPQV